MNLDNESKNLYSFDLDSVSMVLRPLLAVVIIFKIHLAGLAAEVTQCCAISRHLEKIGSNLISNLIIHTLKIQISDLLTEHQSIQIFFV